MKGLQLVSKLGVCLLAIALSYILLCVLFPGLADYRVNLPNGYQLIRPHSQGVYLADPDSWQIIGPYVDLYASAGSLVVGHVSPHRFYRGDQRPQESLGYFVLDTRTGEIQKDMSKAELYDALRKRGVSNPPGLGRPNIFRALLSKLR